MNDLKPHKKLWRIPQRGMIKGVCAGIAQYFDIPVAMVRVVTVLMMICSLFLFVVTIYIILAFVLDPLPEQDDSQPAQISGKTLLALADKELAASERRLREIERYVTSDTFTVRSRFRQL